MPEESVELQVYFADWSDAARAGMTPPAGEATLTAVLNDAGRLSLYLERGARGSLLHIDVTQLFSLRKNAIAKEPGSSYFKPWWCVSRLGLANGGLDSLESSPYVTLSRGAFRPHHW